MANFRRISAGDLVKPGFDLALASVLMPFSKFLLDWRKVQELKISVPTIYKDPTASIKSML
jgi:hypothetical protein